MKTIRILFLVTTLLICNTTLKAQNNYDFHLENAVKYLQQGKCEMADYDYNAYKEATGKTDIDLESMIDKCKKGIPLRISAKIDSVWWEDVVQRNVEGIRIHIKFQTYNMLHLWGNIAAYFYFNDGAALDDLNGKYKTENEKVSTGRDFRPRWENAIYDDFVLFIPYDELHLSSGNYDLKFNILILEYGMEGSRKIANSEYVNITYTRK